VPRAAAEGDRSSAVASPFHHEENRYRIACSRGSVIAGRRGPVRPRPVKTARPDDGAAKEAALELFGTITQVFPSTTFGVELENGHTILAHIAGRLRRHHIKILPGDRVELEMSPYDLTKGRIVYRYRAGEGRRSQ
jgi:translation initiation factor IF-1